MVLTFNAKGKLTRILGMTSNVKVRFCQKVLMFLSWLQTDEHFSSLKILKKWILVIFKAALSSQRQPSCLYKPLSFKLQDILKILSNFQLQELKFSFSGKKNVRLFGVFKNISIFWQKRTFGKWYIIIFSWCKLCC